MYERTNKVQQREAARDLVVYFRRLFTFSIVVERKRPSAEATETIPTAESRPCVIERSAVLAFPTLLFSLVAFCSTRLPCL